MRWLWFVGSLVCFVVVFKTTSVGLALLCLLGALVFMIVGTLAVAAQRIENNRADVGRIIGPEEIRHMRVAEERRKAAQQAQTPNEADNTRQDGAATAATDAGIVGMATAGALIAAESAGRVSAPPAGPVPGLAPGADNAGGDEEGDLK